MKTEPLASNRKIQKNNSRILDLEHSEFKRLSKMISESLARCAEFNPQEHEAKSLRKSLDPLYVYVQKHAVVAFQREFEPYLMFGIKVTEVNLAEGEIRLEFTHSVERKNVVYKLAFRNHMAPYSEKWPVMAAENGECVIKVKNAFAFV